MKGFAGKCGERPRKGMGHEMAGMMLKSWIVGGVALAALSGCTLGTANTPVTDGATDAASQSTAAAGPAATSVRLVDHDVEAPEVFQASDKGLWDGRPSLGGVWVASPDAKNPERVIMRNPANGKFVIGGLFQRDASLPGPKLQLSSDAADALGLVAGEPAVIKVTALRRDETPARTPDASKPLLDANEPVQTAGAAPAGSADVASTAAAAIDKATAPNGAAAKSATAAQTAAQIKADKSAKAAAAKTTGAQTAGAQTAGAKTTGAQTTAAQTAAAQTAAAMPAAKAAEAMAKPTAQAAAASPVTTQTPAAQTTAQSSGSLIQIGIFSVEPNAKRASDVLKKAGIASTTTSETSHDKPLWSVTARGNASLLAKIKAAGFKDAYVLRR